MPRSAQIRFHDRAGNRLRHGEQAPRRFRRSGGCGCRLVLRLGLEIGLGPWQAQKASGFVGDVAEIGEAAGRADDVEQIAVFAGGGIGPFAGRALAGFGTFQTHEHDAARCVPHVADQPVAAFAVPFER